MLRGCLENINRIWLLTQPTSEWVVSVAVAQRDDGETGYRDIYNETGGNTLSIRVGSLQ